MKIPPESVMFPGRGVSLKGHFYTRWVKGKLVVSKWPRPQPTPRTKGESDARTLMAKAARFTAYMSPGSQAFAADLAKVSKLLPRDFLMISLFNRIGYPVFRDGRKVFSMAAVTDVSNLLDAIWQLPGGILVRGDTWWEGLAKGAPNQVLSIDADGLLVWTDVDVAESAHEAFVQPHMDPTLTTGLFGTGAFAGRSVWLPAGTVVNGVRVYVQNPNGPHSIRAALYAANPSGLGLGGGTLVQQSSTISMATGIMSLPLAAPVTAALDAWYWMGLGITGTGNVFLGAGDYTRNNAFWTSVSFPLPSTAPSAAGSSSVNTTWWLY